MSTRRITFDIETGPAPNAREFCREPKDKRSKSIEEQMEDAALDALTGMVLLVGVYDTSTNGVSWFEGPEDYLLRNFWDFYNGTRNNANNADWVGFNCGDFDWPFLIRRSFINGVKPGKVINERGYMLEGLTDLRKLWQCGNKQAPGSLDAICRAMRLGKKSGDGAKFAELYASDPSAARDYCANDIWLTVKLGNAMLGEVSKPYTATAGA